MCLVLVLGLPVRVRVRLVRGVVPAQYTDQSWARQVRAAVAAPVAAVLAARRSRRRRQGRANASAAAFGSGSGGPLAATAGTASTAGLRMMLRGQHGEREGGRLPTERLRVFDCGCGVGALFHPLRQGSCPTDSDSHTLSVLS